MLNTKRAKLILIQFNLFLSRTFFYFAFSSFFSFMPLSCSAKKCFMKRFPLTHIHTNERTQVQVMLAYNNMFNGIIIISRANLRRLNFIFYILLPFTLSKNLFLRTIPSNIRKLRACLSVIETKYDTNMICFYAFYLNSTNCFKDKR